MPCRIQAQQVYPMPQHMASGVTEGMGTQGIHHLHLLAEAHMFHLLGSVVSAR